MADLKLQPKRLRPSQKRIPFAAHVPEAKAVSITGDFTGWSEEGIPLRKGADGEWRVKLRLAPGDYHHRLRVDGKWRDHTEAAKRVSNSFGSENCVLTVGD